MTTEAQEIRLSIDRAKEQLARLPRDAEHAEQRRALRLDVAELTQQWWVAVRHGNGGQADGD